MSWSLRNFRTTIQLLTFGNNYMVWGRVEAYILYTFTVHTVNVFINDDEAPLPYCRHGLLCQLTWERTWYHISEKSLQRKGLRTRQFARLRSETMLRDNNLQGYLLHRSLT